MALTQKVLQAIKKSFECAHWDIKIYWISPDTSRNSTTVITLMISFRFYSLIIWFVNFWKAGMLKTSSLTIIQSKRISPHNQSHFDSNQCLQFVNLNWCVNYTIGQIKMVMLMIVVISMSAWCGIEAFCPFKCHCDDQKMKVVCSAEANLDIIPITLNPGIKEIHLRENQIR